MVTMTINDVQEETFFCRLSLNLVVKTSKSGEENEMAQIRDCRINHVSLCCLMMSLLPISIIY